MLYVNLPIGYAYGWGICGRYLTRELAKLEPVKLIAPPLDAGRVGDPLEFWELQRLLLSSEELNGLAGPERQAAAGKAPPHEAASIPRLTPCAAQTTLPGPLLQDIDGDKLRPRQPQFRGRPNFGYAFLEHNLLQPLCLENGKRFFDHIVTGSTWCTNVLREAGLPSVSTAIQGIDPSIFYPAAGPGNGREFLADKFVVFSGGKFEYRKGQDIVIRAYRVLQDRHADVMLVNAWHNPWPATMETMISSPHIRFRGANGPFLDVIRQVLAANGIDQERVITAPGESHFTLARLYRNTDVGLFPNRCEAGTNLVLMEYMACGQPVVATCTTGHADIITPANAVVLNTKGERTIQRGGVALARWPEPDLDDTIDKLEWAYQNREKLRGIGCRAGQDAAIHTWAKTAQTISRLVHADTHA